MEPSPTVWTVEGMSTEDFDEAAAWSAARGGDGPGSADGTVPATAYSLSTGERLWTLDQTVWPFLRFDGGYLVNTASNHIESIG
jgi:hypothetical protein